MAASEARLPTEGKEKAKKGRKRRTESEFPMADRARQVRQSKRADRETRVRLSEKAARPGQ